MGLRIDPGWVMSSLLLWLRLAAFFFLSPLLAGFKGLPAVPVLLGLALAALFAAAWVHPSGLPVQSLGALLVAGLGELFVGMLLAFGVHAGFAGRFQR